MRTIEVATSVVTNNFSPVAGLHEDGFRVFRQAD
jgi:hypothetical protein